MRPITDRSAAETLALRALEWIAGEGDLLGAFLAETGISPATLVQALAGPEALGAVLDFILAEDHRVLGLTRYLAIAASEVARARAALPGGDAPHWT